MRKLELHIRGSKIVAVIDPREQLVLCAPSHSASHDTTPKIPSITGRGHRVLVLAKNAIAAMNLDFRHLKQMPAPSSQDETERKAAIKYFKKTGKHLRRDS